MYITSMRHDLHECVHVLCFYRYHELEDRPPFLPPMPSQRYNGYTFTCDGEELENRHYLLALIPCIIMVLLSVFISYMYSCNRWMVIVESCGCVFLIACDTLFLLCFPKFPTFLLFISCTVVACAVQCTGNYVWCQHLDWTHDNLSSYLPYILLIPYCVKIYFLLLLIKANFITLKSVFLLDCDRHMLLSYPMKMAYFTPRPVYTVDYRSGSLLFISLINSVLDTILLKRRNEVFEGEDNTSYYDENMDAIAMFTAAKQCLYDCEAKLEKKQAEYEEAEQKFDRIKKSYNEVKNERDELKKQLENHNKQKDTLSRDLGKANKLVADLRKQLSKQQGNVYCCICHDRVKNILLQPCNHLSVCEQCLKEVLARHDRACPLCREKIEDHIKVFL